MWMKLGTEGSGREGGDVVHRVKGRKTGKMAASMTVMVEIALGVYDVSHT